MKRAIFFVLLIILESALYSQNLVINNGFETWDRTDKPTGWTTSQYCLKDSVSVCFGSYSCRHAGGASSAKYLGQTISVIPGQQYNLSFFYKTEITGSGNGCRIWCYWKDAGGNSLPDALTDDILRPSLYLKSLTWQQFSINIPAPSNAVAFYLEVRTYPNSIAFWDDFIFEASIPTLQSEEKVQTVKIFPNPVRNYLNIFNIKLLQNIEIQDISGKAVWFSCFDGEEAVTINVSGLKDGIYILRIKTSEKIITRKIFKH